MTDKLSAINIQGLSITPIDGRNYSKIKELTNYFSELALYKYRIKVELEYLIKLSEWKIVRPFTKKEIFIITSVIKEFNDREYLYIKEIEKKVNHDVKAVEYYLLDKLGKSSLKDVTSFIHFGMTSEDTNNLSYGLILKEFKETILENELQDLISRLSLMAESWKSIPMLARTHGQIAVTTTVGKEIANYVVRLRKQLNKLSKFQFEGKCNGAIGNNNALNLVLSNKDWLKLSDNFVTSLGLATNFYTTQILFYDNYLEFFQIVSLINGILYDLCINIWQYVMLEVFVQKKKKEEVGSSTMPQKINPIYFENAEGNLGLANSLFEFFERKLIHSRLQRDLSDSTIRRNFGESLGYTVLGWKNIRLGLERLSVNKNYLLEELNKHYEILTEGVQTYLRLKGDNQGYDKLKNLIRGKTVNKSEYLQLLKDLGLSKDKNLVNLTPDKYIGYAVTLVDKARKH